MLPDADLPADTSVAENNDSTAHGIGSIGEQRALVNVSGATKSAPPPTAAASKSHRAPPKLLHTLLLRAELERIVSHLVACDIDVVVLKGVPLALRVYDQLGQRPMGDNDLLVRSADVPRAAAALRSLGYASPPFRRLSADMASNFQHPMQRQHETGPLVVAELHWNAFTPRLFSVPENLLWARTERYRLGSSQVKVFDPAMTLVHLAAHYAQHQMGEPRILMDVARAWSAWHSEIDRDDLINLAKVTGTLSALDFALGAAFSLGLTQVPPLRLDTRGATVLARLLPPDQLRHRLTKSSYPRAVLSWLLTSPGRALRSLRLSSFPPRGVMSAIYREADTPLLYRHWVARPLRPLARALGWKPPSRA